MSLLLVAVATVLAFAVEHTISAPNLTLIYVLPVVVAATAWGLWPALTAAVAGVLAFDFFFTVPYFSFQMSRPPEIWAAALLLIVAAIVSAVAEQSRRRALESAQAAKQAEALRELAHVVIEGRSEAEILRAAAGSLSRIFEAPAALLIDRGKGLEVAATAGGAKIAQADEDAARGALDGSFATRGETYPYDQTCFDFWPVSAPAGCRCAIGVDFVHAPDGRPEAAERYVELVTGYIAAGLGA